MGQAHTISILDMGPFGPKAEPPQPAGMRRPRYLGSDEKLLTTLRPFVTSVSFFKYGENHRSKVQAEVLVAHAPLFRELTKLSANLAFKKASLQAAFLKLANENQFPALSTQALVEDWFTTMDARVRIACRHVAKARIQACPPRWLQHIDGDSVAALADSGRDGQSLELPGMIALADSGRDGQSLEPPGMIDLVDSGRQGEESEESESTTEVGAAAGDEPAMLPAGGDGDAGHDAHEPPVCPEAPVTE